MRFQHQIKKLPALFHSVVVVLLLIFVSSRSCDRVEILMSNVTTQKEDAYMCTSYKLADNQQYITDIQPLTNAEIAHHMFAFGCEKPASSQNSWSCESMVCQGSKTILFAWGRDAPELRLPEDVAYKVGDKTPYKYIVVNIHYLNKVSNDRSGLAITVGSTPRRYQAGIMLMVANSISIPPNTPKYSTRFSCKYEGKALQVFAFRVHAHVHGDVNTAYRVRDHEWTRLARGDPQWPQAFYPVTSPVNQIDLRDQDALIGVCTYHNDESRTVYAGSTHNDEMCNVYLMYYADTTEGVMEVCTGSAYPQLENIIPDEAFIRPPSPSGSSSSSNSNKNSHHDMEGTKMHHDVDLVKTNKYGGSGSDKIDKSSLSDLLSSFNGGSSSSSSSSNDDYYDDVEQARSKGRGSKGGSDSIYSSDDTSSAGGANLIPFDTSSLLDTGDDYSESSLLLEIAKLNKKNNGGDISGGGTSGSKNPFLDKVKETVEKKLNNLIPQTITISKYTLIDNWYDSKTVKLGQIGGIEVNQKTDQLVIFHRGSQIWQADSFDSDFKFNMRKYKTIPADTIVTINRSTGKVVSSWGSNQFLMPHGLSLDSEGFIWVTDVGRHQVLKIDPNTHEIVLEVGERLVPGSDRTHFCQPADVAVLKSGEFFVADGYCNSRIVKFSKDGTYLGEWSSEEAKMPSHFFVPHSLALNEANNLLCVADRENFRVQCFDLNGNFLQHALDNQVGPIYAVSFATSNASVLYAVNGYNSRGDGSQYDKKIYAVSTKTGNPVGMINLAPEIRTPHDIALSDDASEIYVANLNPPGVYKYALVNYNFNKVLGDKKKGGKKGENEKDSFRTSMFIMGFLVVPLVLAVVVATIVRLKNMGKLRRLKLAANGGGSGSTVESRWKKPNGKPITKNGFTRLNQESEDEEAESLNKPRRSSSNRDNSDYDTEEDNLPTMSKA